MSQDSLPSATPDTHKSSLSPVKPEKSSLLPAKPELAEELRKLITEMSDKIQSLETKLSSMNDKMDAQKFHLAQLTHPNQGKTTEVAEIAANNAGTPPEEATPIPHDPEAGFTQDAPVQNFRKALIIFQGLKYPEAILAFSDFLEKYPDHPMAGAAQFYTAEAYRNEKEYKLALQEYQKLLTTYDRSSHIAETLKQMAIVEDGLKRPEEAARHRQLLTSLLPLSPAAAEIENASKDETKFQDKDKDKAEADTQAETKEETKQPTPEHSTRAAPLEPSPRESLGSVPPTAPLEDKKGSFENKNSESKTEKIIETRKPNVK